MAAGLGVMGVLFVAMAGVAWSTIGAIGAEWGRYRETVSARVTITKNAGEALGDATHAFKNFILRGGDYAEQFGREIDNVEKLIAGYRATGEVSAKESAQLDAIKPALDAYRSAMQRLVTLRQSNKDPLALDQGVKSSERPVRVALRELGKLNQDAYEAKSAEVTQRVSSAHRWLLGISLGALLFLAFFGHRLTRSITAPVGEAVRVAELVAAGDLTSRIEPRSADETGRLMRALRAMNDGLSRIVSEVRVATDAIAAASGEILRGNTDMSRRTEEQASHLEETAASMEELTATVKQNADNATLADQHIAQTAGVAEQGKDAMSRVVATMEEISGSSRRIVDIVGVIDSIAFQTNILALNAAVEAARAGEQGRGFAVVAAEVRGLAQRSAEAAKEIKSLIGASVASVQSGTALVDRAGKTMEAIVGSVQQVKALVSQIAVASQEQRSGIEQVSRAVAEMERMTQQNAALVEQSAATAGSLDEHSRALAQSVETFKLERESAAPSRSETAPAPAPLALSPPAS